MGQYHPIAVVVLVVVQEEMRSPIRSYLTPSTKKLLFELGDSSSRTTTVSTQTNPNKNVGVECRETEKQSFIFWLG